MAGGPAGTDCDAALGYGLSNRWAGAWRCPYRGQAVLVTVGSHPDDRIEMALCGYHRRAFARQHMPVEFPVPDERSRTVRDGRD